MAKVVGRLKAKLGLDSSKYEKGLKGAKKKTSTFASGLKKLGALAAGAFAVKKIVDFGKAVINAADKQIQAEQKLKTAIEANGKSVDATFKSHARFASQLQKETTVGDETTLMLLQMAESMSSDAPQQAAKGAIALSKAYGMNLQAALKGVTRAQQGDYQMLQRYIPAIKTAGTEAEKHAEFQKALANGYEVAKTEAKSGLGPLTQLQNAWGDIQEKIGAKLLPVLNKVAQWFMKQLPAIEKGFGAVRNAVVGVINYFIDLYNEAVVFRGAIEAIKLAFKTVWEVIKLSAKNIINVFQNIGKLIKQVFTGQWKEIGTTIKQFGKDIAGNFKDFGKNTARNFKDGVENTLKRDKIQLIGEGEAEKQGKKAGEDFAEGVKEGAASAKTKGITTAKTGKTAGLAVDPSTDASQLAGVEKVLQKNKELQKQFQTNQNEVSLLGNIATQAFQGMSNSLQKALDDGKNIIDSFGKFFMDMLKSLIIKLAAAAAAALLLSALLGGTGIGSSMGLGKTLGGGGFKQAFGIMGFADGGITPGGPIMVGEKGPEILSPPPGARITPNHQLGGGRGNGYIAETSIGLRELRIRLKQEEQTSGRFE
ncbi:MAG: hypothetical protein R6U65_08495 [Perlabentimonas sp.]